MKTLKFTLAFGFTVILSCLVIFNGQSSALNLDLTQYLTLGSTAVRAVALPSDFQFDPGPSEPCDESQYSPFIEDPLDLIAVGEKIWKFVQDSKPVVKFQTPLLHVLPRAEKCWVNLESWRMPQASVWEIIYKNQLNMDVAHLRFRILFTSGGQYQGKGQFLSNITVQPAQVSVGWGYNLNAQVVAGQAVNRGTKTDPLAGQELLINWEVKTVVKDIIQSVAFFIQGDGQITKLKQ